MGQLRINCPECGGELVIDRDTGAILAHRGAATQEAPAKDLDALFRDLDAGRARAEEVFEQGRRAHQDRDRLLEERFRQALERAEENPDEPPPRRPFDLD